MRVSFQLMRFPEGYGYRVLLYRTVNGKEQRAKPFKIEWEDMPAGMKWDDASFDIMERDVESLFKSYMDHSRMTGQGPLLDSLNVKAQLDATKFHLEDMRKLVFERRDLK